MRRFVICFVLLLAASSAMAQTDPGAPDSVIVDTVSSTTSQAVLTVTLSNDQPLSGFQIPLQFANDLVIVDSVIFGGRTSGFTGADIMRADTNLGGTQNTITLVVVPLQTGSITAGSDAIATLYLTRNSSSTFDTAAVTDTAMTPFGGLLLADTVGNTYGYRPVFVGGQVAFATGIGDDRSVLPTSFALGQNYPNPFNPSTSFVIALPTASYVTLDVFNLLGQRVSRLYDGPAAAGYLDIQWDGRNDQGRSVGSGVYFYRMLAGDFQQVRKMVLLK